ncbi:MAG: hypothetical protein O7A71_08795 [Chloroflexi bacterium]|nr:hypothetical protein [Chloroflexota bacterium]
MDRTFLAVILFTLVLLVVAGSVIAARGKPDKPPKPRGDGDPPAELVLTLAVSDVAASAHCSGTLHAEWNVDGAKGGKIKFELREYDGTWSVAHAGRTTNDGYEEWTLTDRPVGSYTYDVRFQSGKSWVFSNMVTGLSCD